MDYIIFGLGVGATLTLVGWALREWGTALRDRSASGDDTILSGHELVDRMAWQRFCRSCGAVLAIFGLLVLLATIVATALMLSNTTGTTIVLTTLALCVAGTLVWLGLFLHRFGARGILRPKTAKPAPAPMDLEEGTGDIPGDPEAATVVGPPIPGQRSTVTAGQAQRPGDMVHLNDEATADVAPVDDGDGRAETEETAEPVEDMLADERGGIEGGSDHDSPPLTGPVIANGDTEGDDGGDDQPTRTGDVVATSEPATRTRRIVMVPAKEQAGDSADADDTASPASALADTDDSAGEVRSPSGVEPDSDDERPAGVESSPSSSGRADAVRKLRQRRTRRLTHDSSPPE